MALAGSAVEGESGGQSVAVSGVVFEDVPPVAQARIEDAWREGLELAGATVSPSGAEPCADERCLAPMVQESSTFAAGLRVGRSGRDYAVQIVLVDPSGSATVVDAECAICGFDEVAQLVEDKARGLETKLAAALPGELEINSRPAGARVLVDGEAVGVTPHTMQLPAGEHVVRLELDGHFPGEQSVVVVSGGRESRSFELDEVPPPGRDRSKWIAGWTLLGVGVAALAGGGAFWAYHHQDVRGRCDDPANLDVNGTCRYRYDALGPAVGLTVVGAAAVLTGVTLVVLGRGRSVPATQSWRVRPLVGPGSLQVRVEF